MNSLYLTLKAKYGKAEVNLSDSETIEVQFNKARESVIIQKGEEQERYIVSYPKVIVTHNKKKEDYVTSHEILKEGLLWILKKVDRFGYVPE